MSSTPFPLAAALLAALLAAPAPVKLAVSDVALYDLHPVTVKDGKEKLGRATLRTLHGHDLRDGGNYLPVSLTRADLPAVFAFRMPPSGEEKSAIDLAPRGVIPVRAKGEFTVEPAGFRSTFSFTSRGPEERGLTHRIANGKAAVTAILDVDRGVIKESRVEISYWLVKLDAKANEKPAKVERVWVFKLREIRRARYPGFQKDVDAAIDRGVAHLRSLQMKDGSFKPYGSFRAGTTALAVLTLASCDVPRIDPALENGLAYLCKQLPKHTYSQALALMAVDRAYTPAGEVFREHRGEPVEFKRDLPKSRRAWAARMAKVLEGSPRSPGSWSYPQLNPRAVLKADSSNTQYGVLGLRAAARLGIEVKERTWTGVIRHFELVREREGPRGSLHLLREGEAVATGESAAAEPVPMVAGFRYATLDGYKKPWASMTCAGIASLAIAREQLRRMKSRRLDKGLTWQIEKMILSGWAWLDVHWRMDRHPEKPGAAWYYYYLYSLERAGILTGVKRVGGKDWYFEGAVELIARQGKKGEWNERGGVDITETCFALLFLKRATAPITPSGR